MADCDDKINVIPPQYLAQIVMMVEDGTITRQTGRELQDGFFLAAKMKKNADGTNG